MAASSPNKAVNRTAAAIYLLAHEQYRSCFIALNLTGLTMLTRQTS